MTLTRKKKKVEEVKKYSGKRINKKTVSKDVYPIEKLKKNLKKLNGCKFT
jgi:hypothetical protein